MSELTIETLVPRLERLERENRWLKWLGCALVITTIAAMLINAKRPELILSPSRTVEAEKFVLKDSSGKVRAVLGESESKLSYLSNSGGSQYGLFLYNKDGKSVAELIESALNFVGEKEFAHFSPAGVAVETFKQSVDFDEVSKLAQAKKAGKLDEGTKKMIEELGKKLGDTAGSFELAMNPPTLRIVGPRNKGSRGDSILIMANERFSAIDLITYREDGTGSITFNKFVGAPKPDATPKERQEYFSRQRRVSLDMSLDGASLNLYDNDGKLRAALGSTDLQTTRTGETHQRQPSSLVLFDKDGKVLWSAPR